ncbi:Pycsar system effector family protein [Kitasatospora sp. NPDC004669]|uniref:Pycsar system effector family protein n=1 Tax=Kitasatospora sp. NPDC004669 TaxID=3154555 RepID=UPI0033ADB5A2
MVSAQRRRRDQLIPHRRHRIHQRNIHRAHPNPTRRHINTDTVEPPSRRPQPNPPTPGPRPYPVNIWHPSPGTRPSSDPPCRSDNHQASNSGSQTHRRTGTQTTTNHLLTCRFRPLSAQDSGNPRASARTDSKAGLLLGLDGVLTAAVAILAQANGASLPVITPAAAILLAATLLAVLVVRPRITPHDRSSYAHWADCTPTKLRAELIPDRRMDRLRVLSALCHRKMLLLRWASDTTIAALVALSAAALIAAA